MKQGRSMKLLQLLLAACAAALSFSTAAQDFPSRPVKIIAPTAPGTGTDVTARFLADRLAREWNQSVIVENKVGANGILGADFAAKAAPDGYTLLMGLSGLFVNKSLYRSIPYDPVKDFRVLLGVNDLYLALVVPASSPFKTVKDLTDHAARDPGKVTYGSAGSGSTTHLGPALFGSMANVQFTHVPYKGGAQAITDTISGQVDFAFTAIATAAPQLASGRLRALAVSGAQRAKGLPNVPTLAESGLSGFNVSSKTFIAAPAGLPDAIAQKITAAVAKIIATPDYQKFLEAQGFEAETRTPAQYQGVAAEEVKHWAEIVRISGAKAD
ncbi:MAG: tripartite tricarboxylate transporter substrate binding protein [Comamonadaceae bacterium]|nr:MAG: tripartite tricarboxylate transporter substrate binding protein [Comamonadaceae bacterium]